jgi:predicted Fe-Mo cluster-binding NifX family protein
MKIAISSTGSDLDAQADPRFGRCEYFLIVELDDMSFEALDNTSTALEGGAGIQSAKLVVDKGARAVVTGSVGPNAAKILSEAGMDIVTGVSGTIRDLAQQYKDGRVRSRPDQVPPVSQTPIFPSGMGAGRGMGRSMGMGRGGRGRGRGFAAGPGGSCVCPSCGERVPHQTGTPCFSQTCPKCGAAMTRE